MIGVLLEFIRTTKVRPEDWYLIIPKSPPDIGTFEICYQCGIYTIGMYLYSTNLVNVHTNVLTQTYQSIHNSHPLLIFSPQGTDRKGGRGGRWGQATAQTDGKLELTVGHG